MRKERSQTELYVDPERADALLWSRRRFMQGGSAMVAAMSARLGTTIRFGRFLPAGYLPIALADQPIDSEDGLPSSNLSAIDAQLRGDQRCPQVIEHIDVGCAPFAKHDGQRNAVQKAI